MGKNTGIDRRLWGDIASTTASIGTSVLSAIAGMRQMKNLDSQRAKNSAMYERRISESPMNRSEAQAAVGEAAAAARTQNARNRAYAAVKGLTPEQRLTQGELVGQTLLSPYSAIASRARSRRIGNVSDMMRTDNDLNKNRQDFLWKQADAFTRASGDAQNSIGRIVNSVATSGNPLKYREEYKMEMTDEEYLLRKQQDEAAKGAAGTDGTNGTDGTDAAQTTN